jgi:hypothetical protein
MPLIVGAGDDLLGMSPNHFEEHIAPSAPRARVGKRNLWDVKG